MPTPEAKRVARNLAAAFLAGDWEPAAMAARGARACGGRFRFLRPLARRLIERFPEPPEWDDAAAVVLADAGYRRAATRHALGVVVLFRPTPRMRRPAFPLPTELPALLTTAAVADWLGFSPARLDWYADCRGINRVAAEKLRHYAYTWVPKPGGRSRLLEAPKPGLKRVQRHLLRRLLDLVPPHDAAHAFRAGRSVVTHAAPHCGRAVVLRIDLSDFFPSVPAARVMAVFRALGYPVEVARTLAGLCTTRLPPDVWRGRPNPAADGSDHPTGVRFAGRHLPQRAPTSPALANLCAYRLDVRLAKLADAVGAAYTRYADDLTFSGGDDLRPAVARLRRTVFRIAAEEGFAVNARKTRVMGRGGRQHVTGVVVNVRPNVPRPEFDALKAILTNCVRTGPAGQNRGNVLDFRGHLAGRVSHVSMLHPARGRKLWAIFDRIGWPGPRTGGRNGPAV